MANITVDILARVTGYLKSLSDLLSLIQKLDPGASISKNVTKAFELASNEVKGLSKNMFPKASSDTLIDAIVEKANHAGEAIQNVVRLLLLVTVNDLNFGNFGTEIDSFRSLIAALELDLNTKLNQGLLSAVLGSQQLKDVFAGLGTDLSKADANTLFLDLSKGALDAAGEVKKALAEVDAIEKKLNDTQLSLNKNKLSILATQEGRMNLDAEIKGISDSYNNIFDSLRSTMEKGLSSALKGLNVDTKGMLDTFFKDLTPENIKGRILELFSLLSGSFNGAREFYKVVFGADGKAGSNINNLVNTIDLRGSIEAVKAQFLEFMALNGGLIKPDLLPKITRLIDTDSINEAVLKTINEFDSAFGRVLKAILEGQEKLITLTESRDMALKALVEAQTRLSNYDTAITNLQTELDKVKAENENLVKQIADLRAAMELLKGSTLEDFKSTAGAIGRGARLNVFPTDEANAYKQLLDLVTAKEQALGKLQGVVLRWFSIYAAIRMVRLAIDSVISTVKELDATITEIAIVTSMDLSELWDLMPKYTQLARDYAASISGVYQVSQLYYQLGLQTADVMALTELTLKMARISGLDYAQATDYMTNAVRSFKMEMTDALRVVDVYSAIAASSATSVTELASAMSKTASSAQAVGSSFENTTAMMAVMIEATRESAENIGSAMKSIISRYGEMTSDPSKLVDSEGLEMSLNRVDKALLTVGISIHNAAGEFRNFDDVIMELAEKWNTIDTNTLRYIATIMAGNRQQSRFLALVSSYDRLKELSAEAAESEDASLLQFLKTLDSVKAKTQLFLTSVLALYVNSGIEDLYKGILDWANLVITSLDLLSDKFGLLASVGKISATFTSLATLVTNLFTIIKMSFSRTRAQISAEAELEAARRAAAEESATNQIIDAHEKEKIDYQKNLQLMTEASKTESQKRVEIAQNEVKKTQGSLLSSKTMRSKAWGMGASALGLAATTIGASMDINTRRLEKALLSGFGSAFLGIGTGLMMGGGWGVLIGALTAIPGIIEAIGMASESTEEKVKKLSDAITTTNNTQLLSRNELKTLTDYKKKYDELLVTLYESNEAKEEFVKIQNEIAASYPELITSMTIEGNYIVDMTDGYKQLALAKAEAYKTDYLDNLSAELAGLNDLDYVLKNVYGKDPIKLNSPWLGSWFNNSSTANQIRLKDLSNFEVNEATVLDLFGKFTRESTGVESHVNGGAPGVAALLGQLFYDSSGKLYTLTDEGAEVYQLIIEKAREFAMQNVSNLTATAQLVKLFPEFANEISTFMKNNYDDLIVAMNAIKYQEELIDNRMNTAMAEWISVLGDMTGHKTTNYLGQFMAKLLGREWDLFQQDVEKGTRTDAAGITITKVGDDFTDENGERRKKTPVDLWKDFINIYDYLWYRQMEEHTRYLLDDSIDILFQDKGKYNKTNLQQQKGYTLLKEAQKDFMEDYDTAATEAQATYALYIHSIFPENSKLSNSLLMLSDTNNGFGYDFLSGIIAQIKKVKDNTNLTLTLQENIITDLANAWQTISTIEDPDILAQVLSQFNSADLTSLTGITKFINNVSKIDSFDLTAINLDTYLTNLKQHIEVNIAGEIEAYFSTIESEVETFSKAISSATDGMDLKTASEMAAKLGTTLNDKNFEIINGKFYYKDLEAIRNAYLSENELLKTEILDSLDTLYSQLQNYDEMLWDGIQSGKWSTNELDEYLSLPELLDFEQSTSFTADSLIAEYSKYLEALATGAVTAGITFLEYLTQQINDKFDLNTNATLKYISQNAAIASIKSGDLSGYAKTSGLVLEYTALAEKDLLALYLENRVNLLVDQAKAENELLANEIALLKKSEVTKDYISLARVDLNKKGIHESQYNTLVLLRLAENQSILDLIIADEELRNFTLEAEEKWLANGGTSLADIALTAARLALGDFTEGEELLLLKYYELFDDDVEAANAAFIKDRLSLLYSSRAELIESIKQGLIADSKAKIDAALEQASINYVLDEISDLYKIYDDKDLYARAEELAQLAKEFNKGLENAIDYKSEDPQHYLSEAAKLLKKEHEEEIQRRAELYALEQIELAQAGKFSEITSDIVKKDAALIYDTYHSINESVANSMISAIGDDNSLIKVTETNKEILDKIQSEHEGWLSGKTTVGSYVTISAENLLKSAEDFRKFIVSSFDTEADQIKALTEYHNNLYAKSDIGELQKIAGESSMAYEDILNYFTSIGKNVQDITDSFIRELGLDFDSTGQVIISNYTTWAKKIETTVNKIIASNVSEKEKNLARTLLALTRDLHASELRTAIDGVVDNYNKVTDELILTLADSLNTSTEFLLKYFSSRKADGTYDFKALDFNKDILGNVIAVEDGVKEYLLSTLSNIIDNYTESISKILKYTKSGTTSRAEMETFAQLFEEVTGDAVDIDTAFEYDSEIKAWKLGSDYLIRYAYARGQLLGMIDDEYKKYVNDLLKEDVTSSIQEVLSNINNQNRRQELDDALFNYYRNLFQSDPSKIEGGRQAALDLALTTTERWKEFLARGGGIIASVEGLAGGLVDHTIAQLLETAEAEESTEEQIILMAKAKALETRETILKGGEKAVNAYKEINENATAEELELIYNFAANPLRLAYDDLGKKAGETVSGLAAEIMKVSEGFEILELADGTAVITAVGDMVQAYGNLYKRMEGVAGVTTSDLNNVYASLLTANDLKEIDAIELLSSAEGMTYQALGEMLSKYGHKLEDWVNKPGEHGIELLGAGKVRIDDWDKVATSLGLEGGTQEYIDAYKAYNDEQIEYQNKIKDSIKSEIDTLKNAKSGDFINLTLIWKSYGEAFEVALTKAGISEQFKKGILEIKSSADIPKLLLEIGDIAAASLDLIPSELAELSDAIASFLEGLTDLISLGISGGLSYVDKNNLIELARSQLGVNDLEFVQTADGFLLVETSALKLYDALKKVNSFAAGKLFEGLRELLEKVNENFESSSALTAYISSTRQDILNTDNKVSNARKELYKEELDIAKEILAVRATSEDDSFNFMNLDIPAGQNNPLNYMASWKTAFDSIKLAKRTGHMDYKDFYNFVTEVGHLAEITGKAIPLGKKSVENSQLAADLITQAASLLKTVEQDGSYKINLSGLKLIGIDFAAGAQGMSDGIDEGIHQMAQSLIDMLDGLISLLETIVLMEKLSDIDVEGDGIDIEDIFKINYEGKAEYTPIYDEWREDMRQKFQDYLDSKDPKTGKATVNVDLGRFIEGASFQADGEWVNFSDMLNMPASELAKKSTEFQTAYAALINSLVLASLSGNYDVDSIMQSVSLVLAESGVTDLELDLGNMHLSLVGGKISTVTYNKEEYEKLIKSGKTQRQISEAVSKFNHGEGLKDTSFTITDILKLVHNIAYKVENGKTYITSPDGSEQVEIPANGDLSNRAKQMANAWALKELGLDTSKINYTDNGDAVEVTTTIGLKPGIKVRASGDGEITWNPDDDTIDIDGTKVTPTGNNLEEYLLSIIDQYRKKTGQGEKIITDEEILWKSELKIRAQLSSSLVDKNGKALNTSGDPKLVLEISDKAKEVRQMTDDLLLKAFQPDKSGNYTIDIGGKQYTIRAEDITVDGKIDAEKAANTLFSASGLDAALQANISSAIVSGFESLSTTLEGLNAEPATNVANAIQSIGTNADTTAGKVEKLVETLGKLGNFGSSEKPSNKDNKSVDEKLAVKEAEVSVPEVTSDFKDTEITIPDGTEVTAKDGSRVIIDNDIMAEPHSLNPFDMTYLPTDFGNQQVKAGSMMRIDNPIKAIVKEIELDLSEAKPKILGPVNKNIEEIGEELQTSEKNISDSSSSAAESVPKAFSSPMQQAVDIVGQAVASILSHITTMTALSTDAFTSVKEEVGSIQLHVPITWTIGINFDNPIFDAWFSGRGFEGLGSNAEHLTEEMTVNANTKGAEETANKAADYISALSPDITVNAVDGGVAGQVAEILDKLPKTHSITIETTGGNGNGGDRKSPSRVITTNGTNSSTGNFAMSKGTLMGELGPELVVSNGRYFVAGQNGAEMVDLADDAIVFNHLQTEQLLKRGMSSGRGRAVTNERNAVAFAQGNVDGGPAMASASAALNALKQLRAMWESLLGASVSDLGKGGGGGGGGSKVIDPKAWIDTVERWYNLMQEIARLELQITHEEKLRAKLQSDFLKNGKAYYTSLKLSVDSLELQILAQERLNLSREDYLDRRIAALQNNSFGKIYRFDPETKQLEFQKGEGVNLNGFDNAMEFLTDLYGFNEQGKANYTNKQKYEILKANGFGELMLYQDGMEIKADSDNSGDVSDEEWESFYELATEAFRDRMDEYALATQSLRDEIQKGKDLLLELQTLVNEILLDMRDNLMDVENKVLDAIVDLREREIDALQDERDKLEESVNKYVDGLSNALDKEQKMYQNLESLNDLDKQRRRLAILLRSGGSASDIVSLLNDINQSERDMYFDLLQQQIDAILEASLLELERMDTQIEIMNETLEFQKEYGLLWEAVYDVMGGSALQITDFISGNSEFWSKSPLATSEEVNKIFFGAEQWTSYRDNIEDWNKVRDALFNQIKAADKQLYDTSMRQEFGNNYDPTGKYALIFEESYNKYGDVTKASTAARSAYTADKLAAEEAERKRKEEDERKRREQEAAAAAAAVQAAPVVLASGGDGGDKIIEGPRWVSDGSKGCHLEVTWKKQGKLKGPTLPHNMVNGKCSRNCGYRNQNEYVLPKKGSTPTIDVNKAKNWLASGKNVLSKFDDGGMVDKDQIALVHAKEAVFTPELTHILRENILSNKPNSLISLLSAYNQAYKDNRIPALTNNSESMIIENATVNMNVQQLANDYDAKRAGEQALAEIMRIARKTSANNSIRR